MGGDASKDFAIVRPVQDTRRVLHGQRVVVHVRVVNRGPFLVADRLVVWSSNKKTDEGSERATQRRW